MSGTALRCGALSGGCGRCSVTDDRYALTLRCEALQLVQSRALGLQPQTVKNALLDIRRKVGAQSSAQLLYMLGAGELDS
jgi:hypothetical protein